METSQRMLPKKIGKLVKAPFHFVAWKTTTGRRTASGGSSRSQRRTTSDVRSAPATPKIDSKEGDELAKWIRMVLNTRQNQTTITSSTLGATSIRSQESFETAALSDGEEISSSLDDTTSMSERSNYSAIFQLESESMEDSSQSTGDERSSNSVTAASQEQNDACWNIEERTAEQQPDTIGSVVSPDILMGHDEQQQEEVQQCMICFEDMVVLSTGACYNYSSCCLNDNHTEVLECGHRFHRNCLGAWRMQTDCCPVCRSNLEFYEMCC